jgi:hypothetical protein
MTEGSRPSENPRSPEHQDLTGTGSPRSADATSIPADDRQAERGETTSQPAQADDLDINRSGSGGSGGPATPDPTVEGSTGSTMSELLSGEDETEPR